MLSKEYLKRYDVHNIYNYMKEIIKKTLYWSKDKFKIVLLLVSIFIVSITIFNQFVGPYSDGEAFMASLAATYIFYHYYGRKE